MRGLDGFEPFPLPKVLSRLLTVKRPVPATPGFKPVYEGFIRLNVGFCSPRGGYSRWVTHSPRGYTRLFLTFWLKVDKTGIYTFCQEKRALQKRRLLVHTCFL